MRGIKIVWALALFFLVLFVVLVTKGFRNSDSHAQNIPDKFEFKKVESPKITPRENRKYQKLRRGRKQYNRHNKYDDYKAADNVNDTINDISIKDDIEIDSMLLVLLPAPIKDRSEQILVRKTYFASYNKDWRVPNWVMWKLTADHTDGNAPRRNSFREDDEVPIPRATPADYKGSGWSRGHMCPSGDNKWDARANHETFLLSNLCPQDANLNSGLWNSIEMDCRKWARKFGEVFIICGPLPLRPGYETIGENKVAVPKAFFKIVLCLKGTPKAFGFVVKNKSGEKKSDIYYNTVREVERLTDMDFFPMLPDKLEDLIETHADIKEW